MESDEVHLSGNESVISNTSAAVANGDGTILQTMNRSWEVVPRFRYRPLVRRHALNFELNLLCYCSTVPNRSPS
jgi:hypothetical protein